MNKITKLYYNSSLKLGLPTVNREIAMDGFTVVLGKYRYHFKGAFTPYSNVTGVMIGQNKFSTNKILEAEGLPVPKATGLTLDEYLNKEWDFKDLTYPVVAKPTKGSACGYNVICNLKNEAALMDHIHRNIHMQQCISVEEYKGGLRSYRVLVFYGEVIGVVERIPAHVVGDGEHSIRELIKQKNIIRRQLKATIPTGPIRINQETHIIFEEMGITIEDVPEIGKTIPLRYICNSTHGGTFISFKPSIICKENAELAARAARVLGLNLAGFDVLCENISIPIEKSSGFFIEVNCDPDLTIHEQDYSGTKVEVSKVIMKRLIKWHPMIYFTARFPFVALFSKLALVLGVIFAILWGMQTYG